MKNLSYLNTCIPKKNTKKNLQYKTKRISFQGGLTLIELMVALVLGLVLIGGVLNIFMRSRDTFRVNENMARLQETGRSTFEYMSRDIREAGRNPCGATLMANVIRNSTPAIPWWADWDSGTLRGVDKAVDLTAVAPFGTTQNARVSGTDGIIVIKAESDERTITAHDTATTSITLKSTANLAANDVVVACDLKSAAIFQIDTISPTTKVLDHKQDSTNMNCSGNLGYPTPTNCTAVPVTKFQGDDLVSPGTVAKANGVISKLATSFWYVGVGANGKRSLYRTRIIKKTVGGAVTITNEPEEIFSGVQNMEIAYLTKNTTNPTASATDWVNADNSVFDAASGGWGITNANQVVAVRITLTLRSDENVGSTNQPVQRTLVQVIGLRSRSVLF